MRNPTRFMTTCIAALAAAAGPLSAEPGVTADTVTLGQAAALKGPAEGLGTGMQTGLSVYFDKVNAAGGVNGRKIELKSLNDGYEPDRTTEVTKMLVEKVKVFALIGGVGTPTSKAAVPIAEAAQTPYLAPFTGAEFLRNPYNRYVVNVRGSYFQEMETLTKLLVDQRGMKKIACFYQNDAYGQAGLEGIKQALQRRGMTLVGEGTYERNTVAIAEGLGTIAGTAPEAVVMVGAYKPCAEFIKSAKAKPELADAVYCNISFVGTQNLHQELGAAADEKCIVSQVVPYPWDTSIPLVKEYNDAMSAAGKSADIGFISLEGYMAAKLFCDVLGKLDGEPTREAFLAKIAETGTFDLGGVTLEFGPDDHQGMDTIFLTTFKGGKIEPLAAN